MKNIRFIHAADLHLDSPFQGLRDLPEKLFHYVRESTFEALQMLVNHAINYQVDFVVLAGDLFDGENRSLMAQAKLKKAMEQLHQFGIACYIIHGNHDPLNGTWIPLSWPENVFFFKDEVEVFEFTKNDVSVHLYGYSYPQKIVKENIASQFQRVGTADFHIGILHGTAEGQEGHDNYAPFSIQELVEKDFDYWALGHIHKRQILHESPFVAYSGNIQGRHSKEKGEKGVFLVELDDFKSSKLTFLPTSTLIWEELTIPIKGIETIDELKTCCETTLHDAKQCGKNVFAILRFIGSGPLHTNLMEEIDDLVEILNWNQEEKEHFTFIVERKLETIGEWDRDQLKKEQHLLSDIVSTVDRLSIGEDPLHEVLAEVYRNQRLKRFLTPISQEQQRQLLQEAESYILTELLKERDE
ncbi:DNA repair exonuclease [Anaerobacillus sp. CMMVII]|uniref:metallophosphoesterase family protein n=1 Tax=Anaerobacillus sp. CMMVII TaxID=2755588 RepID=UPI0021B7E88A|nr:DNA repair exonuclease [Anaerobacillus sp. CMMVII]MCT8139487.1 DNA repair exonuclease [Anaerobacillus sp. CMMVII]